MSNNHNTFSRDTGCGKWDYCGTIGGKKCGKWDFHFNVWLAMFVEIIKYSVLCIYHLISNLLEQTSHLINRNRTYWYGLHHSVYLWILTIGVRTLQVQVEYIIHDFQHRFSSHGHIGIISSMLVSTHVFQTLEYWCDFFKNKRSLYVCLFNLPLSNELTGSHFEYLPSVFFANKLHFYLVIIFPNLH